MCALFDDVRDYLEGYVWKRGYDPSDVAATVLFGSNLLTHAMMEHNHERREGEGMEDCVKRFLRGKRVFEVGCRWGGLLQFMQDHGAVVGGSTDPKRAQGVRRRLNLDEDIIEARAEELGSHPRIEGFDPQIVLSGGLFDKRRSGFDQAKALKSLGSMHRRGADVYVVPADVERACSIHGRHLWDLGGHVTRRSFNGKFGRETFGLRRKK